MLKVNNKEVKGDKIAFDGCHKIYIIETDQDLKEAMDINYFIFPITDLKTLYEMSCSLKFISSWDLKTSYVKQFEEAWF